MASPDIYRGIDIPPMPAPLLPISPAETGLRRPEDYALAAVKQKIRTSLSLVSGLGHEKIPAIDPPPKSVEADLSVATFTLARELRKSPKQIAEDLAAGMNAGQVIENGLNLLGIEAPRKM